MKCVVDKYIPFIGHRLDNIFDEVLYLEPAQITQSTIDDADVLLIRTRTWCNEQLLCNSRVKFIGTATIGTDHIDLNYCIERGIYACNAPGCNARGVAQYVESAICAKVNVLSTKDNLTIGIVGVGHVGSLVEQMAKRYGMQTLLYDPPRQRAEGGTQWISDLTDIAQQADIITFHTPLTKEGTDSTWHIADKQFFDLCRPNALIINAARGGVIYEKALLDGQYGFDVVIDTWEGEPYINRAMLERASIATPHIAGYSEEGKRNATRMILEQLAAFLKCEIDLSGLQTSSEPLPVYDIMADDALLRNNPQAFEQIRQNYKLR